MKCYTLDEVKEADINLNKASNMFSILINKNLKERAELFFIDNPGATYSTIIDLFLAREGYSAR